MASKLLIKHFTSPDETRPYNRGRMDVLAFEGGSVGRAIFEPGWRWSRDVAPLAGTRSCQVTHSAYILSGRMHLVMDSGEEADVGPGDLAMIPPGHDAWTVGDEACVLLDFGGASTYARDRAGAGAQASGDSRTTSNL